MVSLWLNWRRDTRRTCCAAFWSRLILPLICLFLLLTAQGNAADPSSQRVEYPIIILNSDHQGNAWSDIEQAAIIKELQRQQLASRPMIEYMDFRRYPRGEHLAESRALLIKKYQAKKIAAVIALDNPALDFAVENQRELFGNAPLVFIRTKAFNNKLQDAHGRVTGIINAASIAGTVEVMLRLHPKTREIIVVHDYTPTGMTIRRGLEADLQRFASRVRVHFLENLPVQEIYQTLERASPDTLVLLTNYTADRDGHIFDMLEITTAFSQHSAVPLYSNSEARLGHGIVGGKLFDSQVMAREAVKLVKRVLQGKDVEKIPIVSLDASRYMFDYRQLARFHIALSALPLSSTVINRPVSFYDANRNIVLMAWMILIFLLLVICFLIFIIVQRRRLLHALQESEARYSDLYEHAPDMYYSIDVKKGAIKECNETFTVATGYGKEEIIGRPVFDFYHEDCLAEAKQALRQFPATGEIHNAERKVKRKDGSLINVSLNVSAARDADGNITHIRAIWHDITERKQAEDKMRQQRDELSHVRRLVTIGEFATSIAHEINQPLTAILNNAQAARRFLSFDPPDLEELRSALDDIIDDDKRAGAVVHHLRSFLKRQDFEKAHLQINDVIKDVVTILNCEIADKSISVNFELTPQALPVMGDRIELQQVLMNLILNACDAMAEVDSRERRLLIRTSSDESSNVIVAVQDSGMGLDGKELARVFEPFYTTKQEGLGVGLSISKSIIDSHDGRLWAVNNADRGATFYFTLPTCQGEHQHHGN